MPISLLAFWSRVVSLQSTVAVKCVNEKSMTFTVLALPKFYHLLVTLYTKCDAANSPPLTGPGRIKHAHSRCKSPQACHGRGLDAIILQRQGFLVRFRHRELNPLDWRCTDTPSLYQQVRKSESWDAIIWAHVFGSNTLTSTRPSWYPIPNKLSTGENSAQQTKLVLDVGPKDS